MCQLQQCSLHTCSLFFYFIPTPVLSLTRDQIQVEEELVEVNISLIKDKL